MNQSTTIGFIGLGVMGAPMAEHLANAGYTIVTCLNRSSVPDNLKALDVQVVDTPQMVASQATTIITMVPDSPDVQQVIAGGNGVLSGMQPDTLVIDMSSISPIITAELAKQVIASGGYYLDAPVSGGEVGAKAASLTIMAGGSRISFERALPLFQLMGKNITLIGEHNGAGQTCKIANQIIVALNIEAVSEALLFASKAGCDPTVVREALMGGFASSKILEVHAERMINRTFDPGFKVCLHQKDLNLALESARSLGVSLPNTATCQQLLNSCVSNGGSNEDHSSMIKALESLANYQLK